MAINLAKKSCDKLVQAAALESSVLVGALSTAYNFVGAKTVEVITAVTQEMNDYNREGGMNRYGTPTEVQDTKQELTLSQDKSFSMTVDKGNLKDQNNLKKAGAILKAQLKERAIPLYDKYCLGVLAANGTAGAETSAITKSNVATRIMSGTTALDNAEIPSTGRTLFISADVYKWLKLSDELIQVEPMARKALGKGVVGEFDDMIVKKVPSSRMPEGVNFIIVQKESATAPKKLEDAKIHQDPPGLSGNLIEGRWYYDCFVLDARKAGVYVDKNA
ncbi:MAG: hypothetical protein IJ339_02520 [Oscillospiraceae bacterium]|nr:hypothetical protein [Oscillospiraceae bacterium]